MVRERSNAKVHAEGEIRNSGEGESEGNSLIIVMAVENFTLGHISERRFEADLFDDHITTYLHLQPRKAWRRFIEP